MAQHECECDWMMQEEKEWGIEKVKEQQQQSVFERETVQQNRETLPKRFMSGLR